MHLKISSIKCEPLCPGSTWKMSLLPDTDLWDTTLQIVNFSAEKCHEFFHSATLMHHADKQQIQLMWTLKSTNWTSFKVDYCQNQQCSWHATGPSIPPQACKCLADHEQHIGYCLKQEHEQDHIQTLYFFFKTKSLECRDSGAQNEKKRQNLINLWEINETCRKVCFVKIYLSLAKCYKDKLKL